MTKTILITGVNGFAGGHLAAHLLKENHHVIGIGTQATSRISGLATYYCGDLMQSAWIADAIARIRPDEIYHLAGLKSVRSSLKDSDTTFAVNVGGTENLFEAVRKARINTRILVVSSNLVYAQSDNPLVETSAVAPKSPYAQSKYAAENCALKYHHDWSFDCIIARPFNHIGPGQPSDTIPSGYAYRIASLENKIDTAPLRVGLMTLQKDYIDVRDVVQAYATLMQTGKSGDIYNICNGKAYSFGAFIDTLNTLSPTHPEIIFDEAYVRVSEPPVVIGSHDKITRQTGWEPHYDILTQSLPDLLSSWRTALKL
ncbi:MAG: GDP-mannose 4,6-dehydratase [bacterium]|nr:GDP-mannose 4,6-dehydratase [bacterium]